MTPHNNNELHQAWDRINFNGLTVDIAFVEAFVFVFNEYPWMFDCLKSIELVAADDLTYAYGLYNTFNQTIKIRLGRETVLDFIDTLTHELVHHIQWMLKTPYDESMANNYAYLAVKAYKEKRGVPLWK